jgi:glycosyltransferase involved in cell wall biosynthesis
VADGETGFVVESRAIDVRAALDRILRDDPLRTAMGEAARARAVAEFAYEHLVARLAPIAAGKLDDLGPLR